MKILKLATENGFRTHDGRIEEKLELNLQCEDCRLLYFTEMVQWFMTEHALYVEAQCYNAFSWGARVYRLTLSPTKGAPIIHEDDEPIHVSNIDALESGLTEAFKSI